MFVAREAVEAIGLTHWRAPFTGGFECTIPAGTALVAAHDQVEGAEGIGFRPSAYEEMERMLVPDTDRTGEKYNGYTLVVLLTDIGTRIIPSQS